MISDTPPYFIFVNGYLEKILLAVAYKAGGALRVIFCECRVIAFHGACVLCVVAG